MILFERQLWLQKCQYMYNRESIIVSVSDFMEMHKHSARAQEELELLLSENEQIVCFVQRMGQGRQYGKCKNGVRFDNLLNYVWFEPLDHKRVELVLNASMRKFK
jgi:hypothetical protein